VSLQSRRGQLRQLGAFRVDHLSAKPLSKFFRVAFPSKAKHIEPDINAPKEMAARAERQHFTEAVNDIVLRASASISAQRDLVWPASIDLRFAEFAFSIDQI